MNDVPFRLLVVRALTPWTTFPSQWINFSQTLLVEGRPVETCFCHPTIHQVEEAIRTMDPEVVLWCRLSPPLLERLKGWHQGRTFLFFNWDSPTLFLGREHMKEAMREMDHLFTSDLVLQDHFEGKTSYLLPPADLPLYSTVRKPKVLPSFVRHYDLSICVTSLYPDSSQSPSKGVIDRHVLFRALDKSDLTFGLFGPQDPLSSRYPRSYRGYLAPQDFPLLAHASTLCLSLHPHSAPGYLNERTCMILAQGRPLVVDSTEGPASLLKDCALFLDPSKTPNQWIEAIKGWIHPSQAKVREALVAKGQAWIGERASWFSWWSTLEPHLTSATLAKALVLKPYCGLCNQFSSVLQAISMAKAMGRRLWIQGFQPSYNIYAEGARRPIEEVFDLVSLSSAFEWPVREVPPWVYEEGLDEAWPKPQRASHAKLYKRSTNLMAKAKAHQEDWILYGGFIFFEMDLEEPRRRFMEVFPTLFTHRVLKTFDQVLEAMGLTKGSYPVLHLRIEEDMVNHLVKRSGCPNPKVIEILQQIYKTIIDKMAYKDERPFICVGTALGPEMQTFLDSLGGVTSFHQKRLVATRLGKGREIAALIDFLLAYHGSAFGGCDISSFSELLACHYPKDKQFIFSRTDLWSSLNLLKLCEAPRPEAQPSHRPSPGERSCGP